MVIIAMMSLWIVAQPASPPAAQALPATSVGISGIKILSQQKETMIEKEGEKTIYYEVTSREPVRIEVQGPRKVRVVFRQRFDVKSMEVTKPLSLTILSDIMERKVHEIDFSSYLKTARPEKEFFLSPPKEIIIQVPEESHIYEFSLSGPPGSSGFLRFLEATKEDVRATKVEKPIPSAERTKPVVTEALEFGLHIFPVSGLVDSLRNTPSLPLQSERLMGAAGGAEIDVRLLNYLSLVQGLSYYTGEMSFVDGSSISLNVLPVSIGLRAWVLELKREWKHPWIEPFVGAGFALGFISRTATLSGGSQVVQRNVQEGWEIEGGCRFILGSGWGLYLRDRYLSLTGKNSNLLIAGETDSTDEGGNIASVGMFFGF